MMLDHLNHYHFIVKNGNECVGDADRFFGPLIENDRVDYIDSSFDMYDILVTCGIFKSKSHARQNWIKTGSEIPLGYSEHLRIGHLRKNIYILNPIKNTECVCL